MPKKGKKFKVPLTDEEQLLLFQQKMLAEEEATKKKERLIAQFLKVMLALQCVLPNPPASALAPLPAPTSPEVLLPKIHGLQATLVSA